MKVQISILLIIFILKLIDCSSGTLKSLYLMKNKFLLSALLSTLGSVVWYISVLLGVKSDGIYSVAVVALATFIGSYYTATKFKSKQKEKIWTFNINMISEEEASLLEQYCKNSNIQYAIIPCLNNRYYCKMFSKSKEQSNTIKNIIANFEDEDVRILIETSISEA